MNLKSQRILVVDDHQDAADTTAELLRLDGDRDVRVAYDGREAVDVASTFCPAIVVLDINMPVMDGYQAARALRAAQPAGTRLLLVALTGRNAPDDIGKATAAGFDHHLPKPLMCIELVELVDAFFDSAPLPPPLQQQQENATSAGHRPAAA